MRLALILQKTQEMSNRLKLYQMQQQNQQQITDPAPKVSTQSNTINPMVSSSHHFPSTLSSHSCVPTSCNPTAQLTISPIALPQILTNTATSTLSSSTRSSQSELSAFKCPLCLHSYRSQTSLNYHMRKEHSVLI